MTEKNNITILLNRICEKQDDMNTALTILSTQVQEIKGRGCISGDNGLNTLRDKIDGVDEKYDRRTVGALGTALLSLAGMLGTLFMYKFGK